METDSNSESEKAIRLTEYHHLYSRDARHISTSDRSVFQRRKIEKEIRCDSVARELAVLKLVGCQVSEFSDSKRRLFEFHIL